MAKNNKQPLADKAAVVTGSAVILPLTEEQARAIDINYCTWVAASAGSGKTKVLIDRLLRLLLSGVKPEKILVITFTRAAAAEIKNRLDEQLAAWTAEPDQRLRQKIEIILGESLDPAQLPAKIKLARGLFLQMMDEKQNLTISTIHGFCQQLLNHFPLEAGVPVGFRVMEEQESVRLLHLAIDTMLLRGDAAVADWLQEAKRFWQDDTTLKKMIGEYLTRRADLYRYRGADRAMVDRAFWKKNYGWLSAAEVAACEADIKKLYSGRPENDFLTTARKVRQRPKLSDDDAVIAEKAVATYGMIDRAVAAGKSLTALALAVQIAQYYDDMKFEIGVLDYDDLILKAGEMLAGDQQAGIQAWVQYKLASGIKHLLLDEAQDTNPDQWRVVAALIDGFFTMEEKPSKSSFLVVGDGKQSIYGFQRASLLDYKFYNDKWQQQFQRQFRALPFDLSFRSGSHLLAFVDQVFAGGHFFRSFNERVTHRAYHESLPSRVVLKPFVDYSKKDHANDKADDGKEHKKSKKLWQADYIVMVAESIKQQIDHGMLPDGRGGLRPVVADDIMVLLQQRAPWQQPLVQALKKMGVAVAGRDRVVLRDEWLIRDIINAAQWALSPAVDFYLASLLVSPFCGLDYQQLESIALGRQEKNWSLYESLRRRAANQGADVKDGVDWQGLLAWLENLTQRVARTPPFEFFSALLARPCPIGTMLAKGEVVGRAALLGRFGREEEETLNIFFDNLLLLEGKGVLNLAAAVAELLHNDAEIKKEVASGKSNGVRIMTCHGAKGLESPIVFLPDTVNRVGKHNMKAIKNGDHPLFFISPLQETYQGVAAQWYQLQQEQQQAEEEEKHRLLYVALTRAKNLLVISGFGKRHNKAAKKADEDNISQEYKGSWYDYCATAMTTLLADKNNLFDGGADDYCYGADDYPTPASGDMAQTAADGKSLGKDAGKNVGRGDGKDDKAAMAQATKESANDDGDDMPDWFYQSFPSSSPALSPLMTARQDNAVSGRTPANMLDNKMELGHGADGMSGKERGDKDDGRLRGLALHRLLQFLPSVAAAQHATFGQKLLAKEFADLTAKEQEELLVEVMTLLGSVGVAEAKNIAMKETMKETMKAHMTESLPAAWRAVFAASGPGLLVEAAVVGMIDGQMVLGRVDRMAIEADEVKIIDYKSSTLVPRTAAEVSPAYQQQMRRYRRLLAATYPDKKIRTALLFTRRMTLIELVD